MRQEKIVKMEAAIAVDYNNIAGMVVLKDGKIVYENYFCGCTKESRIHVFSVTKSIVSILLGIALDKGYLDSIEHMAARLWVTVAMLFMSARIKIWSLRLPPAFSPE